MGPALLGSGYTAPGFVGSCSRVSRSFLLGNPGHRSLFGVDFKAHAKAFAERALLLLPEGRVEVNRVLNCSNSL
jgi:hypothetical protein